MDQIDYEEQIRKYEEDEKLAKQLACENMDNVGDLNNDDEYAKKIQMELDENLANQ